MSILLVLSALALAGCSSAPSAGPGECVPFSTAAEVDAELASRREAYRVALDRARAWMDRLELDPVALPVSVKPKKKLVELLDGYLRLRHVGHGDTAALQARIEAIARQTSDPRYHDMLEVDDLTFKQNATSYLRAAYLLEGAGVALPRYRAEIAKVKPRLDDHMHRRGAHQRAVFRRYYAHFGLDEPFPLDGALDRGLIARRADPAEMDRWDTYAVTHEIFAPFDYGDRLDADPYDADDLRYLRRTLAVLTERFIAADDPDLVAELVSCMRYIRATDLPQYILGIDMLFATQAADGHWGDYERLRPRDGDLVAVKYELHTTMVAIDALTIAFHHEWNQAIAPIVP